MLTLFFPTGCRQGQTFQQKRQNNPLGSDETEAVYPLFSRKGRCVIWHYVCCHIMSYNEFYIL